MYKLLPGVLLNLSKISATVSIAPNILEFLSTLNRLPEVKLNNIQEKNYFPLSIFNLGLFIIRGRTVPVHFRYYVAFYQSIQGENLRKNLVNTFTLLIFCWSLP